MVTHTGPAEKARDSEAMRARILAALGRMIMRDGLSTVGVNALARESGCDKVLIYRYFGDLDGVYAGFAAQSDFWWALEDLVGGIDTSRVPFAAAMKQLLRRHAGAIRSRPLTLAILAAELDERTPLVVALENVRERRALALSHWIAENYRVSKDVDFEAIGMLLGAAVNYLAVRARTIRVMSRVPIKSGKDWERILRAIDHLIDGVLGKA